MSILVDHNILILKDLKRIETSEEDNHTQLYEDYLKTTIDILDYLQETEDCGVQVAKDICLKEVENHLKTISLKSTVYFLTMYQNILNGRFRNFNIDT